MGVLDHLILRDDQWERMSAHIIGDERARLSSGGDNRMFVEAVLRIVRAGSPWRDLSGAFGGWDSAFRRFSRWSRKGVPVWPHGKPVRSFNVLSEPIAEEAEQPT